MRPRSSLARKALVVVAVPILVQWAFLACFLDLQNDSEKALERALHTKDVSDGISKLKEDMYRSCSGYGAAGTRDSYIPDGGGAAAQAVYQDYSNLLALTRNDDPGLRKAIDNSRKEAVAGFNCLVDFKKSMDDNPDDAVGRIGIWSKARGHLHKLLDNDLAKVGEMQSRLASESLNSQKRNRTLQLRIMAVFAIATLAWAVASALYLTRFIALKLSRLSDNAYRLASNRPLNKVMKGRDEISKLDQTFHVMAKSLREASRKERAVVENARDFICTLDANYKFVAANPASHKLLNCSEDALIGQSFLTFVSGEESQKIQQFFECLKKSEDDQDDAIETQLLRGNGEIVYVMLSAHWSADEKSSFIVIHDITDRRNAEKLRQEVLLMVTHDLRTPLATLQNALKFLRSGKFGNLDQKGMEYVSVSNRNIQRMRNLVDELLDIDKIKSNMMVLDKQSFELNDCFVAARELSEAFAEERGIKIEIRSTDVVVLADQDRLTRVLANLISNAVKFSPPGGLVTVASNIDGGWVYTTVDDQGPGVPEDQIQDVFERFHQVGSPNAKEKGGSGLGLTICKAIVELHGGKIWVENLPECGSRFTFTLKAVS